MVDMPMFLVAINRLSGGRWSRAPEPGSRVVQYVRFLILTSNSKLRLVSPFNLVEPVCDVLRLSLTVQIFRNIL